MATKCGVNEKWKRNKTDEEDDSHSSQESLNRQTIVFLNIAGMLEHEQSCG